MKSGSSSSRLRKNNILSVYKPISGRERSVT
jgi:hypothetical protein